MDTQLKRSGGQVSTLAGSGIPTLINGQGQAADSWVGRGPNQPIGPTQLEQAIGPDALNALSQHTGLSREELLSRLTRELPQAVDKFTPEGRLPTEEEAARLV